jgi:hypothetical protein
MLLVGGLERLQTLNSSREQAMVAVPRMAPHVNSRGLKDMATLHSRVQGQGQRQGMEEVMEHSSSSMEVVLRLV